MGLFLFETSQEIMIYLWNIKKTNRKTPKMIGKIVNSDV